VNSRVGGPGWGRTNDQPIMSPERSTYSHVIPALQRDAADRMERFADGLFAHERHRSDTSSAQMSNDTLVAVSLCLPTPNQLATDSCSPQTGDKRVAVYCCADHNRTKATPGESEQWPQQRKRRDQ